MNSARSANLPVLALACLLALAGCSRQPDQPADAIYFGGDIVTMDDARPTVEAVAVKDGNILMVGTRADLEKFHKGSGTQMVDLGGKTLLPAFLDAHSHYINSLSVANQVNVYPPPAGPGKGVPSIVAVLKQYQEEHKVPAGTMIQAYGYDENAMPAGRQLNRDDLDKAFPDNPVIVGHVSMHGGVLNSLALKQFGYSAATKTPAGGVIVRKPGSQEPYGLIMETAYLPVFEGQPKPTSEQEIEWSKAGQMLYASNGITTAQEGATHAPDLALIQRAAAGGATLIDIVTYPFILDLDKVLTNNPVDTWGKYKNRVKIGGVKITSDGSPQGKTAFFTTPYLKGGPGGEKNWRGELTFPQDMLDGMIKRVYGMNVPLLVHANGDAAIDSVLKANELATGGDVTKHPPVTIIHAQFTRPDQLDQYVRCNFRPSFYTLHTFYFADAHIANRGPKQAAYISPMRDAIDKGIRPTNHTDFVVAPLDQMFMLWSAVNRISRSGEVLGPDQRVSPMEGLKAMTIWVAEQYGEQGSKGSLQAGKLADLVILSENPLKVDKLKIKDIKVVETVKEGKSIYKAKG